MTVTHCSKPSAGRAIFAIAAVAWLLLCLPPAGAQHNSLVGQQPNGAACGRPAATTQPAGQPAAGPARGCEPGLHAGPKDKQNKPRTNATLLRASPFAVEAPEPEKFGVNDQVTIIIRETKTATTDSKLESKKDWTLDGALKKWISLSDKNGLQAGQFLAGSPEVALNWNNDYKGDGKYDRKDEFTTRIQATIVDVKPNGTLVLEAHKRVTVDDEGYTVTLTGDCRSRDVTPQNSVLSTQIANLRLDVKDSGAVRDVTRRGWIQRGLDFLRPF